MLRDTAKEDAIIKDGGRDEVPAVVPILKTPTPPEPVDLTKIKTLHELLALALKDMEVTMRDPRYHIDMNRWHDPVAVTKNGTKTVCHVCMAGIVIANRTGAHPDNRVSAYDISILPIRGPLLALDSLRRGNIWDANHYLHPLLALQAAPAGVRILEKKYRSQLRGVRYAAHPDTVQRLLTKLHELHADLVEAGL